MLENHIFSHHTMSQGDTLASSSPATFLACLCWILCRWMVWQGKIHQEFFGICKKSIQKLSKSRQPLNMQRCLRKACTGKPCIFPISGTLNTANDMCLSPLICIILPRKVRNFIPQSMVRNLIW